MKKSITILEDDRDIREICTYLFIAEGYEVNSFDSVSTFAKNNQTHTDLFLLDIQLPDGNGLQVCEKLKDHIQLKHIPVMMMSANLNRLNLDASRADSFIEKPFDLNSLLTKVALLVH